MSQPAKNLAPEGSPFRVIEDPLYGYLRLDPLPDATEVGAFYESQYYHHIKKENTAVELQRLLAGGPDADAEYEWLRETLYRDIAADLEAHAPGKRLLDVGSGMGQCLRCMIDFGFDIMGVEPSAQAVEIGRERYGVDSFVGTLNDFISARLEEVGPVDAILMRYVLEHVPNPAEMLKDAARALVDGGVIVVQVPNDFTELQAAASKKAEKDMWWYAPPDHINYFNYDSLTRLLETLDWQVLVKSGDFPMELFLLMGLDYTADPAIGKQCHQQRRSLELALPGDQRRRLYEQLADIGIGRNCRILARKG